MTADALELVWPERRYLAGYVHALERGWSPDNLRPEAALDGGVAVERFFKPPGYGGAESIRFRMACDRD